MIVRCTAKVAKLLSLAPLAEVPSGPDDWYVNTVTVARRRVVVAVHAETLFPVVAAGVPVSHLRDLPGWLAAEVASALADEGLPITRLGSLASEHALVAPTASRKITAQLTQLAFDVEHAVLSNGGWDGIDLLEVNRWVRRTLRGRDGAFVVPLELAGRLPHVGAEAGDDREVQTLQLTCAVQEAVPPITRDLEVPVTLTLEQLHHLLQRAFGWTDSHLYRFAKGDSPWEGELYLCEDDLEDADVGEPSGVPLRTTRVGGLFDRVGDQLLYLYDYGDHWELTLTLTGWSHGPHGRALVTGGVGQGPPDDCGGIHSWNEERPGEEDFRVATGPVALRTLRRPMRR